MCESSVMSGDGQANIDNIMPITIQILKVDENDDTFKLGNAEFEHTKVQSLETVDPVTEDQYYESGTTSNADDDTKGTLQFPGVTPGFYYLHETKAPDGYALAESNGWHFQVDENGIVPNVGDFTEDGTFRYVDATGITIENPPQRSHPEYRRPRNIPLLSDWLHPDNACGCGHRYEAETEKSGISSENCEPTQHSVLTRMRYERDQSFCG